jgi:hypothetical protein
MKWKQEASMRFRGISSAMGVLHQEEKINRVPSHEICIQWDLMRGVMPAILQFKLKDCRHDPSH